MSERAWQRMLSGRRLDLIDPSPLDVEIEDIAHGLARVARWNGQTTGDWPFSVAQHSLMVEAVCQLIEPGIASRWLIAALLHDAPEYVIGDMISPFKNALGDGYRQFERKLEATIHQRFDLPAILPLKIARLIKKADRICACHEAIHLAGFSRSEAAKIWGRQITLPDHPRFAPIPTATNAIKLEFLERFDQLQKAQLSAKA